MPYTVLLVLIGLFACADDEALQRVEAQLTVEEDLVQRIVDDTVYMEGGKKIKIKGISTGSERVLIFTRHAEKDTIGLDPGLSKMGNRRAEKLADLLSGSKVDRVYTTHYRRTYLTAIPLLEKKQAKVMRYEPGDQLLFADQLLDSKKGVSLIVGHSNTIPALLGHLTGEEVEPINETEYNNLFVLSIKDTKADAFYKFKYRP